MDLVIDPKTIGIDFKIVDLSVRVILVKKHSASRAIRVFGNLIRNVIIGPDKGASFVIIIIGPSKTCRLFSSPSIWYFYYCSS